MFGIKTVEVTDEFWLEVMKWCDECGHGIDYDDAGTRYVEPSAVDEFITPELIDKTRFVVEEQRKGNHIDLIDYREWVAVCELMNMPELAYKDAKTVNLMLWGEYNLSPIELLARGQQNEATIDKDNKPLDKDKPLERE